MLLPFAFRLLLSVKEAILMKECIDVPGCVLRLKIFVFNISRIPEISVCVKACSIFL